jgi:hypothetical protein
MDIRNRPNSIDPVKLKVASTEAFSEGMIDREVFIWQLKLRWFARAVVHVIGTIDGRAYIQSNIRVLIAFSVFDMELCFLHVLVV